MSPATLRHDDPRAARVAIVGATGAVGRAMLQTLVRRDFPIRSLRLMASARSAGQPLDTPFGAITVEDLALARFDDIDLALFSAGGSVSLEHAPRAAREGAVVVDNTSAFRMDADVPLVVPEVNGHAISARPGIIANPNCSTIQMVLALAALDRAVGVRSVRVATYQSASGAGQKGIDELVEGSRAFLEGRDLPPARIHAAPLAFNAVPWIGSLADDGFTNEEIKMHNETRKIMERPDLRVCATCVRVPVLRCHCEVVNVVCEQTIDVPRARAILAEMPNLVVSDEPEQKRFPVAHDGTDAFDTFVGRIRRDPVDDNGLVFWIVSDNLLKGAAFNAVQIAEEVWKQRLAAGCP